MSLSKLAKRSNRKSAARRVKSTCDARKVLPSTMDTLRARAVRSVLAGQLQAQVARSYGVCEECVSRWMKRYREGGFKALLSNKKKSPKSGKPRKLSEEQEEELCQLVHSTLPYQSGFPSLLWTRKVVAQLIAIKFGISVCERTAGRVMKRHNMSPQRPKKRAYQQDKHALENWCYNVFPELKRQAEETGATIVWIDETTLKSGPNYGRTWSKVGETPVVPTEGSPSTLNVIGALSIDGKFIGMSYETNTNSDVVVAFLEHINQVLSGKVIAIMDNAAYHKSGAVKSFAAKWQGLFEIVYQPPYCPETNPVEIVWAYLKSKKLCNKMTRGREEFLECADSIIAEIMSKPEFCLKFFGHDELSYINQGLVSVAA